jgi:hypothetical protein
MLIDLISARFFVHRQLAHTVFLSIEEPSLIDYPSRELTRQYTVLSTVGINVKTWLGKLICCLHFKSGGITVTAVLVLIKNDFDRLSVDLSNGC